MKVEASGFPPTCTTQQQKDEFIQNYLLKEGIVLDSAKMIKDSAKKQFAKFCLNNLWGFLAKNIKDNQVHFVSEGRELFDLLDDSSKECTGYNLNGEVMLVNSKSKKEFTTIFSDKKTSLILAIFVTAYSRIKLCNAMLQAGKSVHYFDTDSLIYSHPLNAPIIAVGQFLGDWEPELKDDKASYKIVEFNSGGPKNYAYKAIHAEKPHIYVVKIRGFTPHTVASRLLDFKAMRHVILETIRAFFENGCKWPLPPEQQNKITIPQCFDRR